MHSYLKMKLSSTRRGDIKPQIFLPHLISPLSHPFPDFPNPNFLLKKSLETTNPSALPPLIFPSWLLLQVSSLSSVFSPPAALSIHTALPFQPLFPVHPIIISSLMLIRPSANIFSLPPFPLIPFSCLPNPACPGVAFKIPFWVIEPTQHFQRSARALTTHVKVPLLSKLTQPHPHTTCVSATLHSSASARSHHNYNHPNWGPTIKRKRSNH